MRATEGNTRPHPPDRAQLRRPPRAGRAVRSLVEGAARGAVTPDSIDEESIRRRARHRRHAGPRPPDPHERRVPPLQLPAVAGRVHGAPGPADPLARLLPPGPSTARSPSTSAAHVGSGACRRRPGRRVIEPVLAQRVLSALVGIPVLIALVVWAPAWMFTAVVLLFALGAQLELYRMFAAAGIEADSGAGLALGALVCSPSPPIGPCSCRSRSRWR